MKKIKGTQINGRSHIISRKFISNMTEKYIEGKTESHQRLCVFFLAPRIQGLSVTVVTTTTTTAKDRCRSTKGQVSVAPNIGAGAETPPPDSSWFFFVISIVVSFFWDMRVFLLQRLSLNQRCKWL